MSFDNYKLLSVLSYPISEDLFKEKIGTGEELKGLVKEKVLFKNNSIEKP